LYNFFFEIIRIDRNKKYLLIWMKRSSILRTTLVRIEVKSRSLSWFKHFHVEKLLLPKTTLIRMINWYII